MRVPPFKCLFCSGVGTFNRIEHPIPESLGNDEITLEPGFVCDSCNQYFGTKVEREVLGGFPFNFERTAFAVPTKKGKLAKCDGKSFILSSTGSTDVMHLSSSGPMPDSNPFLMKLPPVPGEHLARFFLKMGLGLLVHAEGIDVYAAIFDRARRCARYGELASKWDVATGLYPDRHKLKISARWDEIGELETHQIYQFSMGAMASGDIVLNFIFGQHVFACNLTQPGLCEYLIPFNVHNAFPLYSRFSARGSPVVAIMRLME